MKKLIRKSKNRFTPIFVLDIEASSIANVHRCSFDRIVSLITVFFYIGERISRKCFARGYMNRVAVS